ncbi:hypothetical protein FPC12_06980 [Salmonella enterica]|nr:hypothetical protein [Salmonella enterica]
MITKEQAAHLMKLVHDVDDASASMAHTAGRDHEEHVEASMEWTSAYGELRSFVELITETSL